MDHDSKDVRSIVYHMIICHSLQNTTELLKSKDLVPRLHFLTALSRLPQPPGMPRLPLPPFPKSKCRPEFALEVVASPSVEILPQTTTQASMIIYEVIAMPPILFNQVCKRDSSSATAKTFSIIFAVVAFLVVCACIIWGYFIPKWRQKYGRSLPTRSTGLARRSNTSTTQTGYVPYFPTHPAILRKSKPSGPITVRQYNPHFETPFKSGPANYVTAASSIWTFTPQKDFGMQLEELEEIGQKEDNSKLHPFWKECLQIQ